MDEAECKAEFRVEKNDLHGLTETLQIPGTLKCYQGTVCDGIEGLCMLLKRLSYPCRLNDTGTVCPISKPGEQQRIVYNGHKRVYALKI